MHLYVPSLGRTLPHEIERGPLPRLPSEYHERTFMVVPHGEGAAYREALDKYGLTWTQIVETPEGLRGIGPTRHWIGEHAHAAGADKFVMMDDDIDFLVRRSPEHWQLVAQTVEDTTAMFLAIEHMLDTYASVGISSREGNNRSGVGGVLDENMVSVATRVMRMFGCRTDDWLEMEHGRVTVMEDFDLQLQLLRAGRGNCCLFYYANGQKQTNSPGGCSTYRDHATQDASARRLAELHPGFVRLRQKQNKTDAAGLGTRTEVTIAWKKAAGI
jgi:hypothetical protein